MSFGVIAYELLKAVVGPCAGAWIGATLAFRWNARVRQKDEDRRKIAALHDAQVAIHLRYSMLATYHREILEPHFDKSDRWAHVKAGNILSDERLPPIEANRLVFLAFGVRPSLLQDVYAGSHQFSQACAAIDQWNQTSKEVAVLLGTVTGRPTAADRATISVNVLYNALPRTIESLLRVYEKLVQEMDERYPDEKSYGPVPEWK